MLLFKGNRVKVSPDSLIEHNGEIGYITDVDMSMGNHVKVHFKSIGVHTDWMDAEHFIKIKEEDSEQYN